MTKRLSDGTDNEKRAKNVRKDDKTIEQSTSATMVNQEQPGTSQIDQTAGMSTATAPILDIKPEAQHMEKTSK